LRSNCCERFPHCPSDAPAGEATGARVDRRRGWSRRILRRARLAGRGGGAEQTIGALGARILLRRHEGFAGDAAAANAMLQRALSMAELAYADSGDVRDLFRCWQAQKRLGQHASATEVAARLAARHAGSLEAQLVALVDAFDPVQSAAAVRSLATQFVEAPVELEAMRVLVELQGGDVPAAVAAADALLLRAPGIMVARYAAALVFHTCAIALPAESTDRASWLQRRDQQLDWLVERAPADEPQRQAWAALRALR
jgi:hypothetical protein